MKQDGGRVALENGKQTAKTNHHQNKPASELERIPTIPTAAKITRMCKILGYPMTVRSNDQCSWCDTGRSKKIKNGKSRLPLERETSYSCSCYEYNDGVDWLYVYYRGHMHLAKTKPHLCNLVFTFGKNLNLGSCFHGRSFSSALKCHGSTDKIRLAQRKTHFSNWVLTFGDSLTAGSYFHGRVFAPYSHPLQNLLRLEHQCKDVVVHENGISGRTGETHSAITTISSLSMN